MAFFNLAGMTLGNIFSKKETIKYPKQTKKAYAGQKGTVKNAKPSNCNLCGICAKKCPCSTIDVDKDKKTWSINHAGCIQCQYCISSCPKKCLSMSTNKPNITKKITFDVTKIPLTTNKKQVNAAAKGTK